MSDSPHGDLIDVVKERGSKKFPVRKILPIVTIRKNTIANFFGRAYQAIAIYIFIPFYVRILGPEAYGIIAFQAILVTVFSLLDAGLSSALAREMAQGRSARLLITLIATMERIVLMGSIFFAVILYASAGWVAREWLSASHALTIEEVQVCIKIIAAIIPLQLLISLYTAGLMGCQKQVLANILIVVSATWRSGMVIPVIFLWPTLEAFFVWQLTAALLAAFVFRCFLVFSVSKRLVLLGDFSLAAVRPLVRFASGMLAIAVVASVNTQLDKILVSKIFQIEDFGRYALASALAQLPAIVSGPILVAVYPRLTELVSRGAPLEGTELYDSVSFTVASLSSISAVVLIAFAPEVLQVWLGAGVASAEIVNVTRLLVLGGLFLSLASTPYYLGLANGHNATSVILGLFTSVALGPVIFFGAKLFGLAGAAIAWPLVNAAALLTLTVVIHKRYHHGSSRQWWLSFTLTPLAVASSMILTAKGYAVQLQLSPVLACSVAGAAAVVAWLTILRIGGRPMFRW